MSPVAHRNLRQGFTLLELLVVVVIAGITLGSVTIYSLTLLGYFIMALILVAFMRWLETVVRRGAAFPGRAPA